MAESVASPLPASEDNLGKVETSAAVAPPMDARIAELLSNLSRHRVAAVGGGFVPGLTVGAGADARVSVSSAYHTPVLQRPQAAHGTAPVLVTAAPNQLIQLSIPGMRDASRASVKADNASSDSPTSGMANGVGDMDDDQEDSGALSRGTQRPKRYRNQKQKLSNSMAQKRYRERKKRAFMDMRQVIDNLQAEVETLRGVKNENDRLRQTTGALEDLVKSQQDQIEALRGRLKAEAHMPEASSAGPREATAVVPKDMDVLMVSSAGGADMNTDSTGLGNAFVKAYEMRQAESGSPNHKPMLPSLPAGHPVTPTSLPAIASQLVMPLVPDAAMSATLQNEWNTHILAMEQVLVANQQQGLPNGPISEEALQLLSRMVSNLYSLNAQLMSSKVQQILDTNRQNTARICRIFNGLAGCKAE
ncbi:unnamed protein product [Ostreobium quekettii]|uniref:BZIP domain-containing protein n=1 Tax=Ostreobium quekettii TaxID=121088 RepID=A0A8S1INK2_9CHLO|nr:unnamed protein product [Ostreobium quekettii]